MAERKWRKSPAVPTSRADRKTQADDAIAAFLAQGGVVKQMPTVATALIACSSCGYSGVVGVTAGKQGRCPRCRTPL